MNATKTEKFTTATIGGNEYGIWHVNGLVTHTSCKGRWAKSDIPTGDNWLDEQLRRAVNEA